MKTRLDKLLVERGLAATRERAQALILAGRVLVSEQKLEKPGHSVPHDAPLRLLGNELRYVSRGGLKLEAALAHWAIDVTDRFCLDVGASTGGFTDCLLQHGAAQVLAIDTGYGQIAQTLRDDPRVTLMERTNARLLAPGDLPPGISFLAMDVSFISATLVLPPAIAALRQRHEASFASKEHHSRPAIFAVKGHAPSRAQLALKGHDFSRAEKGLKEEGALAPEGSLLRANEDSALKGHDFSRAEKGLIEEGALAPEGSLLLANDESALKGHDFSRAEKDPTEEEALAPEAPPTCANDDSALKGHDFSRAEKGPIEEGALAPEAPPTCANKDSALKGHDFSRAEKDPIEEGALAPEGSLLRANDESALKGHDFSRAEKGLIEEGALAPEASPTCANKDSALKGHDFSRAEKGLTEEGALAPEARTLEAVILIKPQFEAGRQFVGKGGIVRDPAGHQLAIDRVRACVEQLGASQIEVIDSPITGAEGNREFLLHALWP